MLLFYLHFAHHPEVFGNSISTIYFYFPFVLFYLSLCPDLLYHPSLFVLPLPGKPICPYSSFSQSEVRCLLITYQSVIRSGHDSPTDSSEKYTFSPPAVPQIPVRNYPKTVCCDSKILTLWSLVPSSWQLSLIISNLELLIGLNVVQRNHAALN